MNVSIGCGQIKSTLPTVGKVGIPMFLDICLVRATLISLSNSRSSMTISFRRALWDYIKLYWADWKVMPDPLDRTDTEGDDSPIWISRLTGHARDE